MQSTPPIPITAIAITDVLLRELNHRVNNNLQIIVSLINLKKRAAQPETSDDIRFIEEHVQAMVVAYRLVYATSAMNEVSIGDLLRETVAEIRQIAKLDANCIQLEGTNIRRGMGLDQAIALGMYFAIVLPPYLDDALINGSTVSITAELQDDALAVRIAGNSSHYPFTDLLRGRLCDAYTSQLKAEIQSAPGDLDLRIRFHLDTRRWVIAPQQNAADLPEATADKS